MGSSSIYLVKDGVATLVKSSIYDTGIFQLNTPGEATAIKIKQVTGGPTIYPGFLLSHMRAYQSTNLLTTGANIHYETQSNVGNEA